MVAAPKRKEREDSFATDFIPQCSYEGSDHFTGPHFLGHVISQSSETTNYIYLSLALQRLTAAPLVPSHNTHPFYHDFPSATDTTSRRFLAAHLRETLPLR